MESDPPWDHGVHSGSRGMIGSEADAIYGSDGTNFWIRDAVSGQSKKFAKSFCTLYKYVIGLVIMALRQNAALIFLERYCGITCVMFHDAKHTKVMCCCRIMTHLQVTL